MTLRFRAKNRDIFEAIRKGKKKVETRAATPKYQNVKSGDKLTLVCGKEKFYCFVKKSSYFISVSAMLKKYKPGSIMPRYSKNELIKSYENYPKYPEKIKKFGIIAWEIKLIEE